MRPERVARLVARWVRIYTRGLPTPVARRRAEEIDADLHDHIAHERAQTTRERRIALGIASRMVRGLPADASWRRRHGRPGPVFRVARATALILLVPLLATQFSDEMAWTLADFVFAGVLIGGTGLMYELARSRARDITYRAAAGLALAAGFMLVWLVGAVGVIGEDGDPADLMYAGVLAVGIIGAAIARLRPAGMARVLLAMALAQALVAVIALLAGMHRDPVASVLELLGLNAFFAALFITSARLFQRA